MVGLFHMFSVRNPHLLKSHCLPISIYSNKIQQAVLRMYDLGCFIENAYGNIWDRHTDRKALSRLDMSRDISSCLECNDHGVFVYVEK